MLRTLRSNAFTKLPRSIPVRLFILVYFNTLFICFVRESPLVFSQTDVLTVQFVVLVSLFVYYFVLEFLLTSFL